MMAVRAVGAARGDRRDVADPAHRHRRRAVCRCPVAELPVVVGAPALDAAARQERTAVDFASGGFGGAADPRYRHRGQAVHCDCPVSEFAVCVVAPAVDAAAREDGAGVVPAGADRSGGGDPGYRLRVLAVVVVVPVAEFAEFVEAPAGDAAAGEDGAAVVAPAAIPVASGITTATGVELSPAVPFPSWPYWL